MFLEQRMYTAHPGGKLGEWLKLYAAVANPTSAKHLGPLMGAFTTEFGPLNRFVFMRMYDDLAHRDTDEQVGDAPEHGHHRKEEPTASGHRTILARADECCAFVYWCA